MRTCLFFSDFLLAILHSLVFILLVLPPKSTAQHFNPAVKRLRKPRPSCRVCWGQTANSSRPLMAGVHSIKCLLQWNSIFTSMNTNRAQESTVVARVPPRKTHTHTHTLFRNLEIMLFWEQKQLELFLINEWPNINFVFLLFSPTLTAHGEKSFCEDNTTCQGNSLVVFDPQQRTNQLLAARGQQHSWLPLQVGPTEVWKLVRHLVPATKSSVEKC